MCSATSWRAVRRVTGAMYRVFSEPVARYSIRTFGQAPGRAAVRIQVTGRGGVPTGGTAAVVLNVTATQATDAGYVQVLPTGTAAGGYSNLNVVADQTIPNLVVVPVGADGSVTVFSERGTHVIVDVFGYFTNEAAPESTDGLFVALSPTRLFDTRGAAMPARESAIAVEARGRAGIPATNVAAVFGNLTATESTGAGFVQVVPGPAQPRPRDSGRTSISTGHTKRLPMPRSPASAPMARCCSTPAVPRISSSTSAAISPPITRHCHPSARRVRRRRVRLRATSSTTTTPPTTTPPTSTAPTTTTSSTTSYTTVRRLRRLRRHHHLPCRGERCIVSLHGKGGGGQGEVDRQ